MASCEIMAICEIPFSAALNFRIQYEVETEEEKDLNKTNNGSIKVTERENAGCF